MKEKIQESKLWLKEDCPIVSMKVHSGVDGFVVEVENEMYSGT